MEQSAETKKKDCPDAREQFLVEILEDERVDAEKWVSHYPEAEWVLFRHGRCAVSRVCQGKSGGTGY